MANILKNDKNIKSTLGICKKEIFDGLYYLMSEQNLDVDKKNSLFNILLEYGTKLYKLTKDFLADSKTNVNLQSLSQLRNAIRRTCFLLQWLSSREETLFLNISKATVVKGRGKKKKYTITEEISVWGMESHRKKVLHLLNDILRLDLSRLWHNQLPEEPFLKLFSSLVFKMLENTLNATSEIINLISSIIISLGSKYLFNETLTNALVHQILCKQANSMVNVLVDILLSYVEQSENLLLVDIILQEVGKIRPSDMTKDVAAAKNISQFLTLVSEKLPKFVLPSIPVLLAFLDGENYMLRNGVIQLIGNVIKFLGKEENPESSRNSLLDVLLERFHDVTSYTRVQVLKTWAGLAQNKCIPIKYYNQVTASISERLVDKSQQVRKKALQTLEDILEYNPYTPQLKYDRLKKQRERAQIKIEELTGMGISQVLETEEENLTEEVKKIVKLYVYYKECCSFISEIHKSIPLVCELLGSKNVTDVVEAIKYLEACVRFYLDRARVGIRKMLTLIWSKEETVRKAVVDSYVRLYFVPPEELHQKKLQYLYISKNLIELTFSANLGELTSLEELVSSIWEKKIIPLPVVDVLWDIFAQRSKNKPTESRGALMILCMMAKADTNIVKSKLSLILHQGLGEEALKDPGVVKYISIAVQCLSAKNSSKEMNRVAIRYKSDHIIFQKLTEFLKTERVNLELWFPAAEQVINALYSICENPDKILSLIIAELASSIFPNNEANSTAQVLPKISTIILSKLFFILGHTALKQLVYLEDIFNEKKRILLVEEKQKKKKEEDALVEELGNNQIAEQELEKEKLDVEREIIFKNLLGAFVPLIVAVCKNENGQFNDPTLRKSAVLALSKYMCVNSEFCKKHLELLFSILHGSDPPGLRANILICIGDLTIRFANLIQPYTDKIYTCLQDSETRVRKNAMMVLTHLILNDMIKVQGKISLMALGLEDEDKRIEDLAKLFFNELSSKDSGNAIYNILPEAISNLSRVPTLTVDAFRNIMRYLFAFIDKEKQYEVLVEKLCYRFESTKDSLTWKNFAYALSLIPYNEQCLKKFASSFKFVKEALIDNEVFDTFLSIITKYNKGGKSELKTSLEEFEEKIKKYQASFETSEVDRYNSSNKSTALRKKEEAKKQKKKEKAKEEEKKKREKRIIETTTPITIEQLRKEEIELWGNKEEGMDIESEESKSLDLDERETDKQDDDSSSKSTKKKKSTKGHLPKRPDQENDDSASSDPNNSLSKYTKPKADVATAKRKKRKVSDSSSSTSSKRPKKSKISTPKKQSESSGSPLFEPSPYAESPQQTSKRQSSPSQDSFFEHSAKFTD
uniref:Uncharacterized protein n=1 Tax=Arcella intermedia TaxID=1963864 RepID=A0A6B2KWU1_9EUKA